MYSTVRKIFPLMLTAMLLACGNKEAAPPAQATPAPAASAPASAQAPAAEPEPAPAESVSSVAINEPLPPFEEDSGIVLTSKSLFKVSDSSLLISGDVFLYEAPNGSRLLRLENVLAPKEILIDLAFGRVPEPKSEDDARSAVVIGALKGPSGNMNYLLEKTVDISPVRSFVLLEHGKPRVLASAPLSKP